MLKNSKIEYNWIFQIVIGYYNWIFLIPVILSLVIFIVVVVVVVVITGNRDYRRMIFSESSPVYMGCSRELSWELDTLSIRAQSSNS